MDTALDEKKYLPKEPLDLPKEPLDLPKPPLNLPTELPKEIPAHVSHEQSAQHHEPMMVKTLLSWSAPGRPYRKRGKEYFASLFFITFLIEVMLFLFSEYLLMAVVLSVVFVAIALVVVPAHPVHYKITSEGIIIEDRAYLWQELYDFYFKKRDGITMLHIQTYFMIPGELIISLGDIHAEQVKSVLLPYLPFREVIRPTFTEKSAAWIAKTFPLEKPKI